MKKKTRLTGIKKKRKLKKTKKRKLKKTKKRRIKKTKKKVNLKGGMMIEDSLDPNKLAASMRLSIQIHEFAMFCHYNIRGDPDFTFYVHPRSKMIERLNETYEDLANYVEFTMGAGGDIENIKAIYDVEFIGSHGMKIPFSKILEKYSNIIPEIYRSTKVERSFINNIGFQLLYKEDHIEAIHNFYKKVREYFCNIPLDGADDYILDLKNSYENKLGDKTWDYYGSGSMGMRFNIKVEDVLIFLIEVINKAEEPDEIIKLAKHYIDLFSTEIGDVRYCVLEGIDPMRDTRGNYIIVKLNDPLKEFVYDNTEMVVNKCYFDGTTPAQYHIGIMRNPSVMIQSKFKKLIKSDKLEIINRTNSEARFF